MVFYNASPLVIIHNNPPHMVASIYQFIRFHSSHGSDPHVSSSHASFSDPFEVMIPHLIPFLIKAPHVIRWFYLFLGVLSFSGWMIGFDFIIS